MAALAYAPDAARLATASGFAIQIWDLSTGRQLSRLLVHDVTIVDIAFSWDGETLVAGGSDGVLRFWSVSAGKVVRSFRVTRGELESVAFDSSGHFAAVGDQDGVVSVWDLSTGRRILLGTPQESFVFVVDLTFCAHGSRVAAVYKDGRMRVWDLNSGAQVATWQAYPSAAAAVVDVPNSDLVVTVGEGRLKSWDATSGDLVRTLPFVASSTSTVAVLSDGYSVAAVSAVGETQVWSAQTGRHLLTLASPQTCGDRKTNLLAFSPDGRSLAVACDDLAEIYAVPSGQRISTFTGRGGGTQEVTFSPDARFLASVGFDRTVRVWDPHRGQLLYTLAQPIGDTEGGIDIAFSPDSKTLATTAGGSSVTLWDVATSSLIRTLSSTTGHIIDLVFSPDSRTLVTAGLDGMVEFWDTTTGKAIRSLRGGDGRTSLLFAPGWQRVALDDGDGIRIVDTGTGGVVATLKIPRQGWAGDLYRFSPDGSLLVTSVGDALMLWSVATGALVRSVPSPDANAIEVEIDPSGTLLVTRNRLQGPGVVPV